MTKSKSRNFKGNRQNTLTTSHKKKKANNSINVVALKKKNQESKEHLVDQQIEAEIKKVETKKEKFPFILPHISFLKLEVTLATRLLYINPVCFLVTTSKDHKYNVMTLSWLTPANNHGKNILILILSHRAN